MYQDWQRLTLSAWAKWTAAGKPLSFSIFGDSIAGKEVFRPRHRNTYRTSTPLWREVDGHIDELMRIDSRLHGALSERERHILLAAVVPLGRVCPASERASAAGVDVETLRMVRRKAMALIG